MKLKYSSDMLHRLIDVLIVEKKIKQFISSPLTNIPTTKRRSFGVTTVKKVYREPLALKHSIQLENMVKEIKQIKKRLDNLEGK